MKRILLLPKTFAYDNRRPLLIVAAAALVAHGLVAGLATVPLSRSATSLDKERRALEKEVRSLEAERDGLVALEGQIEKNRDGLEYFHREVLSTKRERMTFFQREIRRMAQQAGVRLETIGYSAEEVRENRGLPGAVNLGPAWTDAGEGALVRFSTTLPLEGTYRAIRKFLSAVENNPGLFLVIKRLTLRSNAADRVNQISLNVEFSTYFFEFEGVEPKTGKSPAMAAAIGGSEGAESTEGADMALLYFPHPWLPSGKLLHFRHLDLTGGIA
ncbi:MAG: hypothetical protein JSV08_06190 [Acidobacteriota bacterium]|nr:MAG: hypothetical protein JSV08_06190 [Acidobacteriota bacterium]